MAYPDVRAAAVVAIPDEKWIERPLVLVVMAEGNTITVRVLADILARDFVSYQVPRDYVILFKVPKISVGKFDKKEIRRLFATGELGKA